MGHEFKSPSTQFGCSAGSWFNSNPAPSTTTIVIDWQQFHQFLLQRMTDKIAEDRLRYSKKFYILLQNGDAQSLLQLKPDKRIHAMKALSCVARYLGKQDVWLAIRQKHGLTWTTGTEKLDAFTRFFDNDKSLDKMIEWLRQARQLLPKTYSDFFMFCTLTGLRSSECVNSIKLIKDSESFKTYYNEKHQCLEHFRFPQLFIRRTKAAYISFVDKEILQTAQNLEKTPTYEGLKMASKRRSSDMQMKMKMKYCRKIFASYLRQNGGIETEIIDLLQGRVPKSVFTRHYLTPNANYKDRILAAISSLKDEIEIRK